MAGETESLDEGRVRARQFIEKNWRAVAAERTLGYGGPVADMCTAWAFVRAQIADLRGRVPDSLPMIILQSRAVLPRRIEVLVPYFGNAETELRCRLVATSVLDAATMRLYATFAESIWFSILADTLPSPVLAGNLEEALRGWTGPELFRASPQ